MNIKKTIDAVDVIDYVNSCNSYSNIYFLIFDDNTKRFRRILVKDVYIDSSHYEISIRSKNIIKIEESTKQIQENQIPHTLDNVLYDIWTQVSYVDYDLTSETFNGIITTEALNIWNSNGCSSIYFVNTFKISCKFDIVNICYSNGNNYNNNNNNCNNNDDFESVAFRFLNQYANKIREEMDALDTELSMKKDEYERELEDMRNEHQLNIDLLNLEHDNEISDLQAEHEDEISGLQAEHEKCVSEIKRNHEKELKVLKKLLNFVINDE